MQRLQSERLDVVGSGSGHASRAIDRRDERQRGRRQNEHRPQPGDRPRRGSTRRTCLVDANLGLGNIDLLCGLNGYWNLSHVVSGARNVREIVLGRPEGIDVIPGASGLTELADWPATAQADVVRQLAEFEQTHDFLVIDTAAGIHARCDNFSKPATSCSSSRLPSRPPSPTLTH